ncbi:phenylalanine--tRNA ligase subunit beta [Blattabacterium cuenoti]|uniref:phenylalanine--tRNA ligase subunit beta n=1 Tax=Blattabacterium cuenoti TaxID=1653831 RepID=UPI00163B792C|nr:phenylalanine--tRNA ligase subunit beta [Blattabacterium cuenoti]
MNFSFNWIKKYIFFDIDVKKVSEYLIDIGIMVKQIKKKYLFGIEDFIMDIEIPPNRSDLVSYHGIARELYTILKFHNYQTHLLKIEIDKDLTSKKKNIQFILNKNLNCIRFSGFSIFKMKLTPSPNWLIYRLNSIGIKTVNNIIDIIRFIMYELGIIIHIFDLDQIEGKRIFIKNYDKFFIYSSNKNMIKEIQPLSIAGIINNMKEYHKNFFLGNIYMHSFFFRSLYKKYHLKKEYYSFFNKEMDPNSSLFSLRRISFLIKKIVEKKTNNIIISNIIDIYPNNIEPFKIKIFYKRIVSIIGKKISKHKIRKILILLNISIYEEHTHYFVVIIPSYRTDIKREIDLIEEILRIYGINKIESKNEKQINIPSNIFYKKENNIQKKIIEQLIYSGFQEIISYSMRIHDINTLLLNSFFKRKVIRILNPISSNYHVLRTSLVFGMIDCISYNYNHNHFNTNLINTIKIFEIGKIYYKINNRLLEPTYLGLSIYQKKIKSIKDTFFYLKGIIEKIFQKNGIIDYTQQCNQHPFLENSVSLLYKKQHLSTIGKVIDSLTKKKHIFYAEINWDYLISIIKKNKQITYIPISKYPASRRDLSILIDKSILFEYLNQSMKKYQNSIIKKIHIYDFYDQGYFCNSKKSYTISFLFESTKKTLTSQIINDTMKKIELFLKRKFKAEIRGQ